MTPSGLASGRELGEWRCSQDFSFSSGVFQLYDLEAALPAVGRKPQPQEPTALLAGVSDEDLLLAGVPEPLLPAVRALRDDGGLEALTPHLPEDAAEILVGLAAGCSLGEAMAEADRTQRTRPVDTADFKEALGRPESRQRFRIVADEAELSAMLDAPLQQWRIFLHPSQRRLVEMNAKGPVRVLGGAGTGKTVVLMHLARYLARQVFTDPDDRILVTTFTRNLALDLRANLGHLCGDEFERIEFVHLHAWAARFLRRQGQGFDVVDEREAQRVMGQAIDEVGDLGLPRGFFLEEWRRVVQPQDVGDRDGYLRARRVGRGTRLSRRQRVAVWGVLGRYRELLDGEGRVEWADVDREAGGGCRVPGGVGGRGAGSGCGGSALVAGAGGAGAARSDAGRGRAPADLRAAGRAGRVSDRDPGAVAAVEGELPDDGADPGLRGGGAGGGGRRRSGWGGGQSGGVHVAALGGAAGGGVPCG